MTPSTWTITRQLPDGRCEMSTRRRLKMRSNRALSPPTPAACLAACASGYALDMTDHEQRPPDVVVEFHNDPTAPRMARRAVHRLVNELGDPIAESVEIVTSELVTNVVQHTSNGGVVRAWDPKPEKPFHLEVSDEGPGEPKSPDEATDSGGRGLRIIDAVADDWGVEPHDGQGKTVWAEFNRPT